MHIIFLSSQKLLTTKHLSRPVLSLPYLANIPAIAGGMAIVPVVKSDHALKSVKYKFRVQNELYFVTFAVVY